MNIQQRRARKKVQRAVRKAKQTAHVVAREEARANRRYNGAMNILKFLSRGTRVEASARGMFALQQMYHI